MVVLLTLLSALVVLLFVGVLVFYLWRISTELQAIGGTPTSYLAKLRLGLRAIETETGHLATQVTELNNHLKSLAALLQSVDDHLAATIEAVKQQEMRR